MVHRLVFALWETDSRTEAPLIIDLFLISGGLSMLLSIASGGQPSMVGFASVAGFAVTLGVGLVGAATLPLYRRWST